MYNYKLRFHLNYSIAIISVLLLTVYYLYNCVIIWSATSNTFLNNIPISKYLYYFYAQLKCTYILFLFLTVIQLITPKTYHNMYGFYIFSTNKIYIEYHAILQQFDSAQYCLTNHK